MELETTKDINFEQFTKIGRAIAIETALSIDLEISFDFINSDDSIVVYRAIDVLFGDTGEPVTIVEETTWVEFIDSLYDFLERVKQE